MAYQPTDQMLEKYADVLVNFALNHGSGVRKGEVVHLVSYESGKRLFLAARNAVLKAGGNVIADFRPDTSDEFPYDRDFYEFAAEHQLSYFPRKHIRGLVDEIDHTIFIIGDVDKRALVGVDPKKILRKSNAWKDWMTWRQEKESAGKYSWTLALYGTPAMAKEAGLSHAAYWNEIIKACFLDEHDPVLKWRRVTKKIDGYKKKLDALPIERLSVRGPDADLAITLGQKRRWLGGGGANIPSFEIFTSPDWRGTEGWIRFSEPLYRYGYVLKGIELVFKKGRVVSAKAAQGEKILKEMIASENADKIGEFSMTDRRLSRITKFMAETLYDENVGGKNGNMHLALGASFHDCFKGNPAAVGKKEWARLGFNSSPVHTDIVSTAPRTITAGLKGGGQKIIYTNGEYQF